MWKTIYACIVLAGTVVTMTYGTVCLLHEDYGYAIGYTILLLFGATTMWITGASIFNGKKDKDE